MPALTSMQCSVLIAIALCTGLPVRARGQATCKEKQKEQTAKSPRSDEQECQTRRREILDFVVQASAKEIPSIFGMSAFGDVREFMGYCIAPLASGDSTLARDLLERTTGGIRQDLDKPGGMRCGSDVSDFRLAALLRAYLLYHDKGIVDQSTWEDVKKVSLRFEYPHRGMSENHSLLFASAELLVAQTWPLETFRWDGKSSSAHYKEALSFVRRWIDTIARRGFGEWDSDTYYSIDLVSLYNLYDFAQDPELREASRMMIDLILADMAVDSFRGNHASASGRTYGPPRRDMGLSCARALQYLLYGTGENHANIGCMSAIFQATSTYRPPQCVVDIATDDDVEYVNKERQHIDSPRGGHSHYTKRTPNYLLSCAQCLKSLSKRRPGGYTEQIWQATLSERAVVFSNHPGSRGETGRPGYWQGNGCLPWAFQNGNALVCLYNIEEGHELPFIHIWFPKAEFDEVVERDGWILARKGDGYLGVKPLEQYRWTTDGKWAGKEIKSSGRRSGVICEAGRASEYPHFEAFCADLLDNQIVWNRATPAVIYSSTEAGTIELQWHKQPLVDGTVVDLEYKRMDSPYTQSEAGSKVYKISKSGETLVLDFTGPAPRRRLTRQRSAKGVQGGQ
ncbi:MAG: hypothetical protein H8E44_09325 [Planctomycetes bacterium]|nr:hypothetical protein [Planctomycetota bacterium]